MKIAIVADAFGSRHLAPYDDPEWEIWGIGNGYAHLKRADRYFEIHPWWNIKMHSALGYPPRPADQNGRPARSLFGIRDDLGVKQTLVHEDLLTEWPEADRSESFVRFPWEEVVKRTGMRYFTSSVAWCLGYALAFFQPEELGLWGCEASLEEYRFERNCLEFWLGRLWGSGTKITLPENTLLLIPNLLYGFEMDRAVEDATMFESMKDRHLREQQHWIERLVDARTACVFAEGRLRQLQEPKDLAWLTEGFEQAKGIMKECEKGLLEATVRVDESDHYLYERTLGAGALHDGTAKKALAAHRAEKVPA